MVAITHYTVLKDSVVYIAPFKRWHPILTYLKFTIQHSPTLFNFELICLLHRLNLAWLWNHTKREKIATSDVNVSKKNIYHSCCSSSSRVADDPRDINPSRLLIHSCCWLVGLKKHRRELHVVVPSHPSIHQWIRSVVKWILSNIRWWRIKVEHTNGEQTNHPSNHKWLRMVLDILLLMQGFFLLLV